MSKLSSIIFSLTILFGLFVLSGNVYACTGSSDLATHVSEQIDSRISQASPSTGLQLFLGDLTKINETATWNPDSWTKKGVELDFTGVAAWNSQGISYQEGATLITPRHFVTATHNKVGTGARVRFVKNDGSTITRTVNSIFDIPNSDITVGVLDSDVDPSITYYKLINSETLLSLLYKNSNPGLEISVATFTQLRKILVRSLLIEPSYSLKHDQYYSESRSGFSSELVGGDSGQPGFLVIDNEPILIFLNSSARQGSNLGHFISEINQAISTIGGGYSVTEYNPSCFTKYPIPVTISSIMTNGIESCVQGATTCHIRITGSGFTPQNNTVKVGTLELEPKSNIPSSKKGSEISIDIPTNIEPGTYDIVVSNSNGTSNPKTFTITSAASMPFIASISPSSGPLGSTVTLTGTSFSKTSTNNIQINSNVGSLTATAQSTDETHLTFIIPNRNFPIGTIFKIWVDNDEFGFSDENPAYVNNPVTFTVAAEASPPPATNQPPTVSAGNDQSINWPTNSVSLSGSATDDTLPTNRVLRSTWTATGPNSANVSFSCSTCNQTNATFTAPGTYTLVLSVTDGSLSSSDNLTVQVNQDSTPPGRSNGSPGITLSATTNTTNVSISTDESATCYWSSNPNTVFSQMTGRFTTTGGTSHSFTANLSPGTSYSYYVRCRDQAQNVNTNDYPILFSVASIPVDDIPVVDNILPNISISYPVGNYSIEEGPLTIQASASDNVGVVGVRFYLNGTILNTEDTSYPWNTNTTLAPGTYNIYAIARDAAGNKKTSDTVTFTITKKQITITPRPTIVDDNSRNPHINNDEVSPKLPKKNTAKIVEEFSRNLKLNDVGEDVRYLQKALNLLGFTIATEGPGSSGNETTIFDEQTRDALNRYQSKNSETGVIPSGVLDNVTISLIESELTKLAENSSEIGKTVDEIGNQSDTSPILKSLIYILNQIKILFSKIFW